MLLVHEESDVRSCLADELLRRGVEAGLATECASRVAEDFSAFQRAVAIDTVSAQTEREMSRRGSRRPKGLPAGQRVYLRWSRHCSRSRRSLILASSRVCHCMLPGR